MPYQNLQIDWEARLIIPALRRFYESSDADLVARGLGERNLSAHIYFYMRCIFSELQFDDCDLSIDCEYDRNYTGQKRCYQKCARCTARECAAHGRNNTTLTPDIIIHHRGANDNNQVAIEIKKQTNTDADRRTNDAAKLSFLTCQSGAANDTNDYKYNVGYFIDLGIGIGSSYITEYRNHAKIGDPRQI